MESYVRLLARYNMDQYHKNLRDSKRRGRKWRRMILPEMWICNT
jgi:hypothetical protein